MSPLGAVRLMLADDHAIVREGLKGVLKPPRFEIIAEAGDGLQAVAMAIRWRPDVALLDVSMPGLDGLEAARRIMAAGLSTQCVLFTFLTNDALLLEAMEAGVAGYLLKESSPKEIRERVVLAAAGEPGFTSGHYEALKTRIRSSRPPQLPGHTPERPLTAQEETVLRLLVQGKATAAIATEMAVQPATVRCHLHNLYEKIGVKTQAAAVLWGLQRGTS